MRPSVARRVTGIAIALAIALTACSFNNGYVLDVTIDGGDRSIALGEPLALTATVANGNGATDRVTWTSSDTSVATIDATGNVTTAAAGTTQITATSTSDPSKDDTIALTIDPPGALRWTRQIGTTASDVGFGVATDASGNVYVTGYTRGALEGTNSGDADAFLRAYDPNGTELWTRQFGTSAFDQATGVAIDANGNVFVAGYTFGDLEGTSAGFEDAFLRAYDPNGTELWTRQFGTSSGDYAYGVATDTNGNVYVTGYTRGDLDGTGEGEYDAFLRAYDPNGNEVWTRQFGTTGNDIAQALAIDANGNVCVTGYTRGDLAGANAGNVDAFLRAYDPNGNEVWTRQFGTTGNDIAQALAIDANGNVYVTGFTNGGLESTNAGSNDAFLRAYDPSGTELWTRQFGTTASDVGLGVATDANGHLYVTGQTSGNLEATNSGGIDAFLRAYDPNGTELWTRQFGTTTFDRASSVATDTSGHVYVTGITDGALEGTSSGGDDAFLRAYGR